MNDNETATATRPPLAIGAPVFNMHGRLLYIVAAEPAGNVAHLLIGGPAPMARIMWNFRAVDGKGHESSFDEHTGARFAEKAAHLPPCPDVPALIVAQDSAMDAKRAAARQSQEESDAKRAAARLELERLRPAWAVAAIVAELHEDDSDFSSDYHNHRTIRRVVLGWSKHKRDLFPELRKAAATFPDTAHLADAPADSEHREKYSMGGGYYLKTGWRDSSGWSVSKTGATYLDWPGLEFSDAARGIVTPSAPAPVGAETAPPAAAGRFTISEHVHTKKGFVMWVCSMAERVERAEYDALLNAARALGGWYSRAWAGTPAGFAFKSEAAALEFTGQGPGDDAPSPAPVGPDSRPATPAARSSVKPATGRAEKLRGIADALQPAIDDKFRDRRAGTPKQRRQAAEARLDGHELERAQKIARGLADAHDAGTVPPVLASIATRAALLELAKEEVDRSNCGYYDAGLAMGRPYPWARLGAHDKAERAAAAWSLLSPPDPERVKAEAIRQELDKLAGSKIPGYFPTPSAIVAQMIERARFPLDEEFDVLEPSAGSGNIADAVREACPRAYVQCVEANHRLAQLLELKGHNVRCANFLDFAVADDTSEGPQAILMNPPFENGQDVKHVRHAFAMLRPGGVLVAIMGAGVTFRSDRLYAEFREWVDAIGGELVNLPAGAFKESGTGVATVMLELWKEG